MTTAGAMHSITLSWVADLLNILAKLSRSIRRQASERNFSPKSTDEGVRVIDHIMSYCV
jgi:hypothetical protein